MLSLQDAHHVLGCGGGCGGCVGSVSSSSSHSNNSKQDRYRSNQSIVKQTNKEGVTVIQQNMSNS